jgi:hypothetical protein
MDDASDPESRLWWIAGHVAPWAIAVLYLAMCAFQFAEATWFTAIATWLVFAALMYFWTAGRRHDWQTLCMRCLRDVPDDGAQRAQRHQRKLALHHSDAFLWATVAGCGLAVVVALMPIPTFAKGCLYLVGIAPIVMYQYATGIHRPLKPWCPWCRRDDGEEPAPDPVPDPVAEGTR